MIAYFYKMIGFWLDKNNEELVQENRENQTVFYGESVSVKLFVDDAKDGDEVKIFYRIAKLRQELRPDLATGHFHISILQKRKEDFWPRTNSQRPTAKGQEPTAKGQ